MRTIKFRGKRLDDGKWIYGDLVHLVDDEVGIAFKLSDLGFNPVDKVDPNTVGEYTGLKDRNGNEIYEGDILNSRHFDNRMGIPHSTCVVMMTNGWWDCKTDKGSRDLLSCVLTFAPDTVIIGNIVDNPDLMKGGEK